MDEWQHRVDVGTRDVEEDGDMPNHLDVTIRAFVKKGVTHAKPEVIYKQASRDKHRDHPQKDVHGRHIVQGLFIPFVMSTFGGMGPEALKFIRRCAKRNPERTEHMKDVLAAQHAHWIADRLIRAIGPHALAAEHAKASAQDSGNQANAESAHAAEHATASAQDSRIPSNAESAHAATSGKEPKPGKRCQRTTPN